MKSPRQRVRPSNSRRLHPLAYALLACLPFSAWGAPVGNALPNASIPLAGSIISNMAVGEYLEEGSTVVQTSRSNLVQTTIVPVYAFRLDADRSTQAAAGQTIYFSHQLRNTGNISDSYTLTLSDPVGGIDYPDEAVYLDANNDGVPDGAALTAGQLAAIALQSGESLGLLIGATVPAGTTAATYSNSLTLSAKSNSDNTISTLSNNDSVTVTTNAVVRVRKAFSVSKAPNGTVLTVTLTYENTSGTASGQVVLTDDLSAGKLVYQAGTGTWSGGATVTDAAGGDSSGLNYEYNSTSKLLTATLSSVPAYSSGTITFQVAINQSTAGDIPNTAGVVYDPDNNAGTANNVTTTSNLAIVSVPALYGVVINGVSTSASQLAADNILGIPQVVQGGVAAYANYVWNTGNTTDTFNLTPTGSTLPAGSVVEFFRTDGVTPILDSNGDGIPDTGPLAAGASYPIIVKVRFPTTQTDQPAQNYSIFPQAQSIALSTVVDTVEDRTNELVSNLVDLIVRLGGRTQAGVGNGNIDNAGNALLTLSVAAGGTVIYPIRVVSIGAPTSYNLSANSGLNFNNLILPEGVSVSFARAGSNNQCSPAVGDSIGSTDVLSSINGATPDQYLCAVVNVAAGTPAATGIPLYLRAYSPTYVSNGTGTPPNSSADIVKVGLTITNGGLQQVLFTPDLRGQIAVGGTIVYSHTITNQGTTALTNTQPFVVTNDQASFTTTLYYDANDNGTLDATDPIVTDLDSFSSNGANGLDVGESIRIFAKVQNNGTALVGTQNNTIIELRHGSTLLLDQVQDVTTISDTLIRLTKLQALDADCNGVADTGSYTTATLPIQRNSNGQGQCVLYRLTVANEGAVAIGTFNFRDATPAGTVMKITPTCASCTSTGSPSIGSSGVVSGQIPSLPANASRTFEFGVQYDGL